MKCPEIFMRNLKRSLRLSRRPRDDYSFPNTTLPNEALRRKWVLTENISENFEEMFWQYARWTREEYRDCPKVHDRIVSF